MKRLIRPDEIALLAQRGCHFSQLQAVTVSEGFDPQIDRYKDLYLQGPCHLGLQRGELPTGEPCRVERATLVDTFIGDNVVVTDIFGEIAHYHIQSGCCVRGTLSLSYERHESCGEGYRAALLDETGSKAVPLHRDLTASKAFLLAYLREARHSEAWVKAISTPPQLLTDDGGRLILPSGSSIEGCGRLYNVQMVMPSIIKTTALLERGTLLDAHVEGAGELRDVVLLPGSHIGGGCHLSGCQVGAASRLEAGLVAHDTYIGSNCHLAAGEVIASLLGPYVVSLHRSTLLIGGCYSFFNAGSGTNFSNHHYRTGPIHYGMLERGCKTASNAYILWPARIGAFSKVVGRITTHPDTRLLPYSLIVERDGRVQLWPAKVIGEIGLARDLKKWPQRDRRSEEIRSQSPLDYLPHPLATVQACLSAIELLDSLMASPSKMYHYQGVDIPGAMAIRGRKSYVDLLACTLAELDPTDYDEAPIPQLDALGLYVAEPEEVSSYARRSHRFPRNLLARVTTLLFGEAQPLETARPRLKKLAEEAGRRISAAEEADKNKEHPAIDF